MQTRPWWNIVYSNKQKTKHHPADSKTLPPATCPAKVLRCKVVLGIPQQQNQPGEESGKEIREKQELLINTEAGEEEAH